MAKEESHEVSTIFVGGLPFDASPRELDNLCRFLPGFVTSKADSKKAPTVFARFETAELAQAAILALNNQPFDRNDTQQTMRATMAKSDMRKETTPGYQAAQPPPPAHAPPPGPRGAANPMQVDTVASVGAADAGIDERRLEEFFAGLPGFVMFKANPRMGGGFAKFVSPHAASQAIGHAERAGVPASFAKNSMTGPTAGGAPHHQPPPPAAPYPLFGGAGVGGLKRHREVESAAQVDTVASVGAAEAGFDEASLQTFFASCPGFMLFKPNPRMGGGFAKFQNASLAAEAVAIARQQGVPADMAKSSMGPGGAVAPHAPAAGELSGPPQKKPRATGPASQVDTIASVGAQEAGYDVAMLQEFFKSMPGFVAFKPNPRMGGGFAKFQSPELANGAVAICQEAGVPAAFAKSSMSAPLGLVGV